MIKLTDTLCIDADQHQYILGEPKQRRAEDGTRIVLNNTSYYTTIGAALSAAVGRAMRKGVEEGTITTLQDFIAEQQRVQDEFAKLIEPLKA